MRRHPRDVRHPAPADVQARWRAEGAWTAETLLDRLDAAVARFGDAPLLSDGGGRVLSAADVQTGAARVAGALADLGVRPGDVVCWQLPNRVDAVLFAWGVLRLGAVASPITPTLRERDVAFILEQTGARVIAVPDRFRGVDHPAMVAATGFDGTVVAFGDDGLDALATAAAAPRAAGTARRAAEGSGPGAPGADDPAVVLWTSGTTSDPKGVVHTHQSLRHEADTIAAAHDMRPGEGLLLPMPITHVAGLTYGVLLPVTFGLRVVLMDVWVPGRALELVEEERIGVMISTPVFMRQMIDHPRFSSTDTSSLRLFSLGGAGVAPSMVREGAARFGANGCWCKRTYGSTEYPTLTTGRLGDDPERDAETDGPLIGFSELRIVDPATGDDVPPGSPGELLVRGPEMFSGYLDADLDRDAFADGGWFRTGDLATYDGGYLTIVDRLKDIIIRGGENVSAAEVESVLVTHPGVAEAACVATPDPVMGEKVCAYVIARPGHDVTLEALVEHLRELGVAPFKLPERLVVRDDLPRTASGKIQKAPLRGEQRAAQAQA